MTRSKLVSKLANLHVGIVRQDLERIVDIILFEIIEALRRNESVEIRGWGRMKTVIRKARIGRNPASGNRINIPQKRILKWKASKVLLKRLNVN